MHLTIADYAVTISTLVIPLGIGFFYAWKDSKNATRDEYLLGGRRMKILPVSLSLFVTFASALSLIGYTSDFYHFGPMVIGLGIGQGLACVMGSLVTMVPLMHPLQLTSVYDYLEMRYQSKALRMFCTMVGMLETFFYMVLALLAPGLALQAASEIPFWMSVAVVGSIGTFYTAIGGFKSVIWTDVFQTVILMAGLFMLIGRGFLVSGGMDKVWTTAEQGGRTSMTTISPDPRTRHSWWGVTIGAFFNWHTLIYSQSSVQRVSSMRTVRAAKLAYLLNVPFILLYTFLLGALGMVVYVYFYIARCDPFEGGLISNTNQVSLYFMLRVFEDYPGLSGFYMATIFSGALSTLSSGINALTTNTVEDVLAGWLRSFKESRIVLIAKVLIFVYGFVIIGFAYLFRSIQGPVTQMSVVLTGAFGSVVVGIFLVGCTVPWANKYGAFVGGFVTLALNIWIATGNYFYGRKTKPLPSPSTDQCHSLDNATQSLNSSSWFEAPSNVTTTIRPGAIDTDNPYEYGFFLYDISYVWYSCIGVVFCFICVVIFSKLTSSLVKRKTNARLILPILRKFWVLDDVLSTNDTQMHSLHQNT